MTIPEIKQFFDSASSLQITAIRAELDHVQDTADKIAGHHVEMPVTVAILAEVIYQAQAKLQKVNPCDS